MKNYQKVLLASTMVAATLATTACGSKEPAAPEATPETGTEATAPAATGTVTAKQVLANANARKAISMAFNKEYIVNSILKNGSTPADYFVPKNFILNPDGGDWRDGAGSYSAYDITKAQEYWTKAKEELGFDTIEIKLTIQDAETAKTTAEFAKSELEQNLPGLTLTIVPLPFQQKLEAESAGDFEITYSGWGPDYLDARTFLDMWLVDNGSNNAGYNNPAYDALVKTTETDVAARYASLVEAERVLLEDDAVLAPIYQRALTFLTRPEYTGLVRHTFGPDYTYQWVELNRDDKVLHLLETAKAPTLDPNLSTDAVSFNILNAINENLVSLGQDGSSVIPGVATTWDVSEDGLTYTFHLRDDVTFVDYTGAEVGKVTAQSFVDSWDRLAADETAATYQFMVKDVANMESYTAIDDTTLEVKLAAPTPWFLSLLTFGTFGPIDSAKMAEFGSAYGTTLETTISSGPFYLSSWNFSERMVLSKNPSYFDASTVKIDGIDFRVIEGVDNETAVSMYFNNEIDRTGLSGERVEMYADHADVSKDATPSMWYFLFNVRGE